MNEDCIVVLSTFPDGETAKKIARELVESAVVACANIIPAVHSIYRWQGKTEESAEVLGIFKLTAVRFSDLQERLRTVHPYAVPEIIRLDLTDGLPEYLRWIEESCARSKPSLR